MHSAQKQIPTHPSALPNAEAVSRVSRMACHAAVRCSPSPNPAFPAAACTHRGPALEKSHNLAPACPRALVMRGPAQGDAACVLGSLTLSASAAAAAACTKDARKAAVSGFMRRLPGSCSRPLASSAASLTSAPVRAHHALPTSCQGKVPACTAAGLRKGEAHTWAAAHRELLLLPNTRLHWAARLQQPPAALRLPLQERGAQISTCQQLPTTRRCLH